MTAPCKIGTRWKALDICAGNGRDAGFRASAGFDVTAVDFSETPGETLRDVAGIRFVCADIRRFPLGGYNLFDASLVLRIVETEAFLQLWPNLKAAIAHVA